MEIESRSYMRMLLEPSFRDFFGFLSKKDNPNGIWAWLAHRQDVVLEQIARFEESGDVQTWRGYAYGETAYNEWVKKTSEQNPDYFRSRVDYLVLSNLAKKGLPEMGVKEASFKAFLDFAGEVLRKMLQKIQDDLKAQLKHVRGWIDHLGREVEETFSADEATRVIQSATGEIAKVRFWPDGGLRITRWAATHAFESFHEFMKMSESGMAHVDDVLGAQERLIDGTLRYWS